MASPTLYDVTILINDVDVSTYVPYESMNFEDYARQVSKFTMTVENPSGVTPTRNHTVVITADSLTDTPTIFNGIITEVTTKRHGITTHYEIECADQKIFLQKTVLDFAEYTGTDADILGDLLSNAYPDVSSYFDFTGGVSTFASGLSFSPDDGSSLLDSLNAFGDLTGGDWRFENANPYKVTFDTGGYAYTIPSDVNNVGAVVADGNPGNALVGSSVPNGDWIAFKVDLGASYTLDNIVFDYNTDNTMALVVYVDAVLKIQDGGPFTGMYDSLWHSLDVAAYYGGSYPVMTGQVIEVRLAETFNPGVTMKIDNIEFTLAGIGNTSSQLKWSETAETADFNLDIQAGSEYGSDIEFTVGGFDDINSVTVIGGYEEIAVDSIYDNDGVRTHLDLPYPVSSLVVYTNGGTDTTPSWGSALALGTWGSDTLTGAGGDKDVLYGEDDHWLNFNTAPPNLVKSWRITGTIRKPIRIRVEDVADGENTLATSYTDETITSVDEAIAIGQAQLESTNAVKRLNFKTPHPGLKPGQSINVADTLRGLDETLLIQRISTRWEGPRGFFDVECGDEESTSLDAILANANKKLNQSGNNNAPSTQTAVLLTDDSGVLMTDNNGQQLYYIA